MAAKMIVPVTDRLRDELISAERLLKQIADQKNNVNDKDYFTQTADALADLVTATLDATTSRPLLVTSRRPMGARFDLGAGTTLAHHVSHCVTYLRNEVTELMVRGAFSASASLWVTPVVDGLKELHGLLMAAVVKQAEEDLRSARARGATALLTAAAAVSDATK